MASSVGSCTLGRAEGVKAEGHLPQVSKRAEITDLWAGRDVPWAAVSSCSSTETPVGGGTAERAVWVGAAHLCSEVSLVVLMCSQRRERLPGVS